MAYNEIAKKASIKYNKEKRDSLHLTIPKGMKKEWTKQAEDKGLSLTAYITQLIENDNKGE